MLKLYWIEIFLRSIPEMFLTILGIYIVTKQKFNVINCILSTVLMAIATYFIRLLPIYFGVHAIIGAILLVSVMFIIGIPMMKAIYGVLLMYFVLSFSEVLNLVLLNLLNIDVSINNINPVTRVVSGIPSLVLYALFILLIYLLLKMKGVKQIDEYRKVSNQNREKV